MADAFYPRPKAPEFGRQRRVVENDQDVQLKKAVEASRPDREVTATLQDRLTGVGRKATVVTERAQARAARAFPISPDQTSIRAAMGLLFPSATNSELTFTQFSDLLNRSYARQPASVMSLAAEVFTKGPMSPNSSVSSTQKLNPVGAGAVGELIEHILLVASAAELIGAVDAQKIQPVVAGKEPPGTEVPGLVQRIVVGMALFSALRGESLDTILGASPGSREFLDTLIGPGFGQALSGLNTIQPALGRAVEFGETERIIESERLLLIWADEYAITHPVEENLAWLGYHRGFNTSKVAEQITASGDLVTGTITLSAEGIACPFEAKIHFLNSFIDDLAAILNSSYTRKVACCLVAILVDKPSERQDLDQFISSVRGIRDLVSAGKRLAQLSMLAANSRFLGFDWNVLAHRARTEVLRRMAVFLRDTVRKHISQLRAWMTTAVGVDVIQGCPLLEDILDLVASLSNRFIARFLDQMDEFNQSLRQETDAGIEWNKQFGDLWATHQIELLLDRILDVLDDASRCSEAEQKEAVAQARISDLISSLPVSLAEEDQPDLDRVGDPYHTFSDTEGLVTASGLMINAVARQRERARAEQEADILGDCLRDHLGGQRNDPVLRAAARTVAEQVADERVRERIRRSQELRRPRAVDE
jgi:hypothetical protein